MRVLLAVVLALVACDNHGSTPDWSRMIEQPKLLPYGAFGGSAAMRGVPAGIVARDRIADPARRDGRTADGAPITTLPVPITRDLLVRGRERFDIICAACHGIAGDGDSGVARSMQRRRPPSLHEARLVALTPGAMYRVLADGYGLMPALTAQLSNDDRWAVIAYVRTLQLAGRADVAAIPELAGGLP